IFVSACYGRLSASHRFTYKIIKHNALFRTEQFYLTVRGINWDNILKFLVINFFMENIYPYNNIIQSLSNLIRLFVFYYTLNSNNLYIANKSWYIICCLSNC